MVQKRRDKGLKKGLGLARTEAIAYIVQESAVRYHSSPLPRPFASIVLVCYLLLLPN